MFNLCVAYQRGYGNEANITKAKEQYQKLVDLNISNVAYNLATIYIKYSKEQKAFEYYKKAAFSGHIEAMFTLGYIYQEKKDTKNAIKWYKEAAINGHKKSRVNLAYLYKSLNRKEDFNFWISRVKQKYLV